MKILAEIDVDENTFWQLVARLVPQLQRITTPTPEAAREEQLPTDRWFRVNEAAKYASLSRSMIYEACASGSLRHARVGNGGAIRLRKDWIDDWMTGQ